MSAADWELIETKRAQAMADRLEHEALVAATAAGYPLGISGRHSYALGWLAHQCADRIVRLENARVSVVAEPAPSAAQSTSEGCDQPLSVAGDLGGAHIEHPLEITRWKLLNGSNPPPPGVPFTVRAAVVEELDDGTMLRTITRIELAPGSPVGGKG